MKILLVDDEKDIIEVLMFTLESQVEADLMTANSGNEAIDVIKNNDNLDLIICDYNMNNGSGGDVYRYLLDHNVQIPYVMCSSDSPEDHNEFDDKRYFIGSILKPAIFDGIEVILDRYEEYRQKLAFGKATEIPRVHLEYIDVSFKILESIDELPTDVFLRVGENKILKIFSKSTRLTCDDLTKYQEKNIHNFLIFKTDVKLFVDYMCNKIDNILSRSPGQSEENLLDVHTVIFDTVKSIGFSEQIVRATEKSVQYALKYFRKDRELRSFSKKIFGYKGQFLTKHSIALAYVSCGLLSRLPWDSFENRNKLVLASFYHDITIDDPKLNETLVISDSKFLQHPIEAAELIKTFKNFPADVDRIILEHHEHPQGKGFPKKLSASQISPLGTLFNVAHRIVECIFKNDNNLSKVNKEMIFECITKDLTLVGNFKKVTDAFMKTNFFE